MDKLNVVCEKLMGIYDFIGFFVLKKLKKFMVCMIDELFIECKGEMFYFIFVGDGFLYKMVWIIMGILLEIGIGVMLIEIIDEIFESKVW